MGEVLADPAPASEDFGDRGVDRRRSDPVRQSLSHPGGGGPEEPVG